MKQKPKEETLDPSDDDLRNSICKILKKVDFNTVSSEILAPPLFIFCLLVKRKEVGEGIHMIYPHMICIEVQPNNGCMSYKPVVYSVLSWIKL